MAEGRHRDLLGVTTPINSSSIPALRIARNLRRKKRAEGGAVFPEDIKRVHIRSDAPAGAEESAMAGRTSTVPSWGMTSAFGTLSPGEEAMSTQELGDSQSSNFISKAGSVIGGIAKGLFYDFPKNMIDRSVQNPQPGLRREDFTDIPPDTSPDPKSAFGGIGVDVPNTMPGAPNGGKLPSDQTALHSAITEAFEAGAKGILISREYDEMRIESLRTIGETLRGLGAF